MVYGLRLVVFVCRRREKAKCGWDPSTSLRENKQQQRQKADSLRGMTSKKGNGGVDVGLGIVLVSFHKLGSIRTLK